MRATGRKGPRLKRMQASLSSVDGVASNADGVAGFINPAGMALVISHLRDRCHMRGSHAVFCDIGCGEARPVMAALEGSPSIVGAIGFDHNADAILVARRNIQRFAEAQWDGTRYVRDSGEGDASPATCVMLANLLHVPHLECVTHAYTFCYGMPAAVLRHVFRVCADTPPLRYLVLVYKKRADDLAFQVVDEVSRTCRRAHHFLDERNASQLHMPGQTVHGCCFPLSPRAREILTIASDGARAHHPPQSLCSCFVGTCSE